MICTILYIMCIILSSSDWEDAMDVKETVACNLRRLRDDRKLSLDAAAQLTGVYTFINALDASSVHLFVDVSGLYGKAYEGQKIESAADFASILLEKKYVAVVPCADFGMPDYIRLSYATSMELIKKGMDRIEEMVKELK